MRTTNEKGFTLVELLLVITIMGIIAGATMPLLSSMLNAHASVSARSSLYQEGLLAMERMITGVRKCTFLNVPNSHNPTRGHLIFSGTVNDDNDFYFGDPLFPRIDEDLWRDSNNDGDHGLNGIDDDGDGSIDEGFGSQNEDEDDKTNEDDLNGIDDDRDGNIDEDMWADLNMDWANGILGMDDDGDGYIDEGNPNDNDDDEDGAVDEDPTNEILYWRTGNELRESHHWIGDQIVLSTHTTNFTATYITPTRIEITLELTGEDGTVVTFSEDVYIRNVLQKTGKRVR